MTAQAATEVAPVVPAPTPPDAADAWYAPAVREQDEVYPDVVVPTDDYTPAETDLGYPLLPRAYHRNVHKPFTVL